MSQMVHVNTLVGTYADGTNLIPIMRSSLKNTLASIGVTGTGDPVIHVKGFNGVTTSGTSFKLSDYSRISALQHNGDMFAFDVGIFSDNIQVPISEITVSTDTPSASADIRMNYFFEFLYNGPA